MDRLFQRYADPFLFMGGMIHAGRFDEFVSNFIQTMNRETEQQNKDKEMQFHWECWLHRVFDRDFKDYMEEIDNDKKNQSMSERTIETTIQQSMNILNNFNPEKRG